MIKIIKYDYKKLTVLPAILVGISIFFTIICAILIASGNIDISQPAKYIKISDKVSYFILGIVLLYAYIVLIGKTGGKSSYIFKLTDTGELKILFTRMFAAFILIALVTLILSAETTLLHLLLQNKGYMSNSYCDYPFCRLNLPLITWLFPLATGLWAVWAFCLLLIIIPVSKKIESRLFRFLIITSYICLIVVLHDSVSVLLANRFVKLDFNFIKISLPSGNFVLRADDIVPRSNRFTLDGQRFEMTESRYGGFLFGINILSIAELVYSIITAAIYFLIYYILAYKPKRIKLSSKYIKIALISIVTMFYIFNIIFVNIVSKTPELAKEIWILSLSNHNHHNYNSYNITVAVNEEVDVTQFIDLDKYIEVPRCTLRVSGSGGYIVLGETGLPTSVDCSEYIAISENYKTIKMSRAGTYYYTIDQVNRYLDEEYNVIQLVIKVTDGEEGE